MSTKKQTTAKTSKASTHVITNKHRVTGKQLKDIFNYLEEIELEGEEEGIIRRILLCFVKGYTRMDIVAAGFNKSTVYRQTRDYEKLQKAPAIEYMGFPLYEARVQRIMTAKGCTRQKAIDIITEKDLAAVAGE